MAENRTPIVIGSDHAAYALKAGQMLSDVVSKVSAMKPLVEFTNKLWYTAASQPPHY